MVAEKLKLADSLQGPHVKKTAGTGRTAPAPLGAGRFVVRQR